MARRNRSFSREVESAIGMAAQRYGIDPNVMRGIARIESSGNPRAQTGSYSGLFQLSQSEFRRGGGRGDIYDPAENAMAGARVLRGHQTEFEKTFKRPASPAELYMIHQQGWGGFNAHMQNPDRPAWENMASTREGRSRGDTWARRAISLNTLPAERRQYGDNITSRQFMDMWTARVSREHGLGIEVPPPVTPAVDTSTMIAQGPDTSNILANIPPVDPEDEAQAFANRPDVNVASPEMVASAITPPIVQGVDDPLSGGIGKGGTFIGSLFGGHAGTIGKGLSAAGRALSSTKVSIPQYPSLEAQMAELDRGAQTPVPIQARKPRKPPAIGGRGGTA